MLDDDNKEAGHLGEEALRSPEALPLNSSSKDEILAEVLRQRTEQDLLDNEVRMLLSDGL
jgi:hypothetical protein